MRENTSTYSVSASGRARDGMYASSGSLKSSSLARSTFHAALSRDNSSRFLGSSFFRLAARTASFSIFSRADARRARLRKPRFMCAWSRFICSDCREICACCHFANASSSPSHCTRAASTASDWALVLRHGPGDGGGDMDSSFELSESVLGSPESEKSASRSSPALPPPAESRALDAAINSASRRACCMAVILDWIRDDVRRPPSC
mmetsp:Transcript_13101/g.28450  ORF Transcript_13101/g.28450 Transcript_13101/m.28450 type:complete len:206 (+) Transcript_13101:365-982(+)